jgi:hypothetical protein
MEDGKKGADTEVCPYKKESWKVPSCRLAIGRDLK